MTDHELLQLINKAATTRETQLDLSYCELTTLPREIGKLDQLVSLEIPLRSGPRHWGQSSAVKAEGMRIAVMRSVRSMGCVRERGAVSGDEVYQRMAGSLHPWRCPPFPTAPP